MTDLLVFVFPNAKQAELGRDQILSLEKQDLVAIEDAVVVVRKADGAITLDQLLQPAAFWGVRAAASGYPASPGAGALTDFGKSDKFEKDVSEAIPRGGTAIFALVSKMISEKVFEALRGAGANVSRTSFDKSAVDAIRAVIAKSA
jgi:uncharacterized membrane protein